MTHTSHQTPVTRCQSQRQNASGEISERRGKKSRLRTPCLVGRRANSILQTVDGLRPQQGFTLIELLLVTSLIAVLSIAIYSSLSNGLRLWQRVSQDVVEEDLNLFLDRISSDIRNGFPYSEIPFFGQKNRLEFPTIVTSPDFPQSTVGQISYFYDAGKKTIDRTVRDYSDVYLGHDGVTTHSLERVHMLVFLYYVYDVIEEQYIWLEHWEGSELPIAVRMMFAFGEGRNIREFSRTVSFVSKT